MTIRMKTNLSQEHPTDILRIISYIYCGLDNAHPVARPSRVYIASLSHLTRDTTMIRAQSFLAKSAI